LKEAIDQFGPILMQKYGQSECPNMVTTLSIEDHLNALKNPELLLSCGRPDVMAHVKIFDDNDKELKLGEVGEICVHAPFSMKGYLNQPDLTRETLRNGWLHTGDMGRMDENGYVYIVDRKKDMVISGGMNVYPAEVEGVISKHPRVMQVSVIGIPDEKWGEAVTAVIIRDGELSEQDVKDFCRNKLSKYAQPKNIVFQEQLPLTLLGKVDKKALRAPFWKGIERAVH
jgi:fatty-acyl-CoA synthase/long-chain acyl-CoA synthetase